MNWTRLYNAIFYLKPYKRELDRYIATVTYGTALLIWVSYTFYAVFTVDWPTIVGGVDDTTMLELALTQPGRSPSLAFYALFFLSGLTVVLLRQGYLKIAVWLPPMTWYIISVLLATTLTTSASFPAANVIVLVVIAGLLIGWRGVLVAVVAGFVPILVRASQDATFANQTGQPSFTTLLILIAGTGVLIYFYLRFNQVSRSEGAAEAVQDQSVTALVLRQIAYGVADRVSPQQLMREVVDRIVKSFTPIYYTQIFILSDDGSRADLVAASGEDGAQALNEGYSVTLGTRSIISQVIDTGGSVIEGADGLTGKNERLPGTEVQIVVPLRIGPKVLGALDVQSQDATAFDEAGVITTFQALADSLALAIDNVSQYERAEARLIENERLVTEARDALREVERLNERLIGTAWANYIHTARDSLARTVNFETQSLNTEFEMTPTIQDAIRTKQIISIQRVTP